MPLARIISRSHEYAKQLAFDLLARGYTVEIVAPDAIPNTPADLELRVQAGPSSELAASVETHDGARSATLEFLHRLKPAVMERLGKPQHSAEAGQAGDPYVQSVSFNAEHRSEDMEAPGGASANPPDLVQAFESLPPAEDSARLISPTHRHANFSIAGELIDWSDDEGKAEDRSEVWFWRAAMGFAAAALLILVLGLAMRRDESAIASEKAPAAAAVESVKGTLVPAAVQATGPAVLPLASTRPSAAVPKPQAVTSVRRPRRGGRGEDVVASDTVVYFNKAAAKVPVVKPAPEKQISNSPAPGKSDGSIKHYSDLQ